MIQSIDVKKRKIQTKDIALCGLFTALICIGAFIRIPLFTIPITLQFLAVNLCGLLLRPSLSALSVGTYLFLGLIGLPIFTKGGGISYISQPTFGYLVGFMAGAWAAGMVINKARKKGFKTYLLASFINLTIVYLLGTIHYYVIANYYTGTPIGAWSLILTCCIPTIPSDVATCIISSGAALRLRPALQ